MMLGTALGRFRILKQQSFALSKRFGLMDFVARSAWRRRRLLILCYHGVSLDDEHLWNPHLYVSPATLRRRLDVLRRNEYHVMPLGPALKALSAGTLPERAVVLTFDDGYYDFRARAYPLLKEYGYPATVYLPTYRCGHNYPVVRLFVSYVLWRCQHLVLDGRGLPGLEGRYPLHTATDRRQVFDRLEQAMQHGRMDAPHKDDVARRLAERLGLSYEALFTSRVLRLLTPADVTELSGPLVDFQLHTHHHQTPEDPDRFAREVRTNREHLEAMTGKPAVHFCYPGGVYRPAYLSRLRQQGVISATTCDPGVVTPGVNPLLLPRFIDTELVGESMFEAWITGVAGWLPQHTAAARPVAH